jgi:hypothetical protein
VKRVLKRMFGLKREKIAGGWKNCIMRSSHNLYSTKYYYDGQMMRRSEV